MVERLVAYVQNLPEEQLGGLTMQDMALCRAWYESLEGDPPRQSEWAFLPERIALWQRIHRSPDEGSEGRRHQILLRELIDSLAIRDGGGTAPDELAFLCAILALLDSRNENGSFERLSGLLAPHAAALRAHRVQTAPAAGLPGLVKRVHYVTEREIRAAPARTTRLLAGIEMPCRGPVYTSPCHLRVLGDVPENCTVVVEHGGQCGVDGYVLGRVLSKQQCEVRGNISGVAVVLHGDVRARSIINNAQVVAKMGNVLCRNAQGPKLVFAGRQITVRNGTLLGNFIARTMSVDGDVRGGMLQVAGPVEAQWFRHLGANNLAIVLRRELSPGDYGEVTGAELSRLLSEAYRLRRLARNFDAMGGVAAREAEHTAQSVLMFLFGGGEAHKKLEEIVAGHRRLSVLSRIIENLEQSREDAHDGLLNTSSVGPLPAENEVPGMEPDGPMDQDLTRENEDALRLQKSLAGRRLDRGQATRILNDVMTRLQRLTKEHRELEAAMLQREREIQAMGQYEQLFAGSGRNASKLETLQKILPALRRQPEGSPIASRLKTAFAALALRNIERRLRYTAEFHTRAATSRIDFRAVSERLGKDFQIQVLERPEDGCDEALAAGRFEPGVKIYTEVFVEDESDLPPGSVLTTPEDDESRTYRRSNLDPRFHLNE